MMLDFPWVNMILSLVIDNIINAKYFENKNTELS